MRLCDGHWRMICDRSHNPLLVNILIMQLLLDKVDPDKYGGDIYKLQSAIGDKCPVCFLGEKGEDMLEEALMKEAQP